MITHRPPAFPLSKALILFVCAAILFLRKPDQFFNPQFWAEDGVFYHSWYIRDWAALIEPYAGYLHTLPRLIAATCWIVGPEYAPHWFVGCAALVSVYVCARSMAPRQLLPGGPLLAFAVVLVPDAFEVLLNVANLQWVVAAGFFLLLTSADPTNRAGAVHDAIASFLAGLTGPFSILLAPLFIIRAAGRRTHISWILAILVTATAAIQVYFVTQYREPAPANTQIQYLNGFEAMGVRLAGSILAGGRITENSPTAIKWTMAALTVLVLGLSAARSNLLRGKANPPLLEAAFTLLLAASLYRCRWVFSDLQHPGYGSRYFFPLQIVLLWMVISWLSETTRPGKWGALAFLLYVTAVNIPRLRESALADLHWADYAPRIRAGEAVTIPINPAGSSWRIPLPARPTATAKSAR